MVTVNINMSGFEAGRRGLIKATGLSGRVVTKKEISELIKTLVRLSPAAANQKIREDITRKFHSLENPSRTFETQNGKLNKSGDVIWYSVDSRALYGVAKEADMRDASVEDLKALLYKITKSGRIRGQRGKQAVYIWKKITTKAATVRKLIALKIKSRGRLKAGWLVSVFNGAIQLTGGSQPPDYVTRHQSGARGYFFDGTGDEKNPKFTIANTAAGVGQRAVISIVKKAVAIRAKAMAQNALMFMRGKKKISDYA